MHLHHEKTEQIHTIRAYGEGYIVLNTQQRLTASVIVTPHQVVTDRLPAQVMDLTAEHMGAIAQLAPEVVILGTGRHQRFPAPDLTQVLLTQRMGVEVMATDAACRTYNILVLEGRRVIAALWMIE